MKKYCITFKGSQLDVYVDARDMPEYAGHVVSVGNAYFSFLHEIVSITEVTHPVSLSRETKTI